MSGQGKDYFSTFALQSGSEYQATYVLNSGDEDLSNCGWYTLSSFLLIQGGLTGQYYTNRWLAGDAYITKPDEQINFNWGTDYVIPGVTSNYVSAQWNGFLRPDTTADYVFEAQANDGVRVYLDQELVIDQWTQVADELSGNRVVTSTISLAADVLVPIKVEYFEIEDQAFMNLLWSIGGGDFEVVPSANLFFLRSETPISGASSLVYGEHTPRRPTDVI